MRLWSGPEHQALPFYSQRFSDGQGGWNDRLGGMGRLSRRPCLAETILHGLRDLPAVPLGHIFARTFNHDATEVLGARIPYEDATLFTEFRFDLPDRRDDGRKC